MGSSERGEVSFCRLKIVTLISLVLVKAITQQSSLPNLKATNSI